MKNYKKILAAGLVVTMTMGSSVVALAEDAKGTGSGTGGLDVVEQSDVFNVVLPTDSGTTFNYILDPTGVIAATNADKYGGATFAENETLYFANAATTEGGSASYSATSDAIKVTNKSTMDVDITVTASVKEAKGITMAESSTFDADDTAAKIYLAIKDSDDANADKAVTTAGISLTSTIAALDDAYEIKYVDGAYVKELKADATGFEEYSFQLTGACNPKGEWTGLKDTPPTVDVVWSVADPTEQGPAVSLSESGLITISRLTEEANIADAASDLKLGINGEMYPINTEAATWITDEWDAVTGGTLKAQLNSPYAAFNGETVEVSVELSDGNVITCSGVVNIAE